LSVHIRFPRNGIGPAQASHQAPRDLDEKFIARRVAEAVVEHLEFVDVDEKDCKLELVVSLRDCQGSLQTIEKQSPVWKVSQPIVESTMLKQCFGSLALSDITVDDDQSFSVAIRTRNRARRGLQNMPGSVFVANPVFEAIAGSR
jgi:hypothetical protein